MYVFDATSGHSICHLATPHTEHSVGLLQPLSLPVLLLWSGFSSGEIKAERFTLAGTSSSFGISCTCFAFVDGMSSARMPIS